MEGQVTLSLKDFNNLIARVKELEVEVKDKEEQMLDKFRKMIPLKENYRALGVSADIKDLLITLYGESIDVFSARYKMRENRVLLDELYVWELVEDEEED